MLGPCWTGWRKRSPPVRIDWSPAAHRDLLQIIRHIAQDDPGTAYTILEAIEERTSLLGDNPALGRTRRVRGTRELVITGTPYIVAYRVRGETVQVLREIRGAQRWPGRM